MKETLIKIAEILSDTGRDNCIKTANLLLSEIHKFSGSLNFRNLGLQENEVIKISVALSQLKSRDLGCLRSISFSYNNCMTERTAIGLIESLPYSIAEIGMVQCGLKDGSGKALLTWLKNSVKVRMICIEQNGFSAELKNNLTKEQKMHDQLFLSV